MRSLVVVVLAALLLTGCTSRVGGDPDGGDPTAAGPVDLAVPIELRPVLATESTDPAVIVLTTEDGERLTLAEPILTIRSLDKAEVVHEQNAGTWVLDLDLDEADGRTFGDWTTDHTGERLAMVADDEVLMAPQIQAAITGGEIQIAANYTRDDAEALLERITGR
ncbi:SecDF P1 head subdomain-containing protein [Actinophytocola glycyrrhizae]|uniref:SecDF P1 head subdomain domain-containing protein n=1 Tax=Actinophytocola glycyrrhizae TaxID=2044873 RepID=A0ABV9SB62_9PSEU